MYGCTAKQMGTQPQYPAQSLDDLAGAKQDVSWGVFPLMNHDVLYVGTNGGGGYLDPLERDPKAVFANVRNNVVSLEAARSVYGTEGLLKKPSMWLQQPSSGEVWMQRGKSIAR